MLSRRTLLWLALPGAFAVAAGPAASQSTPAPAPTPTPTPLTQPTATPVPSPTPLPTPPVLPPNAPPEIVAYSISTDVLYSGETITGYVVTSTNVASVEVRVATISINMPRTDFGQFSMSYQVPNLPFFVPRGPYTMRIIARNTPGDAVEQDLPVTLR
jgi:hypothetical protein